MFIKDFIYYYFYYVYTFDTPKLSIINMIARDGLSENTIVTKANELSQIRMDMSWNDWASYFRIWKRTLTLGSEAMTDMDGVVESEEE